MVKFLSGFATGAFVVGMVVAVNVYLSTPTPPPRQEILDFVEAMKSGDGWFIGDLGQLYNWRQKVALGHDAVAIGVCRHPVIGRVEWVFVNTTWAERCLLEEGERACRRAVWEREMELKHVREEYQQKVWRDKKEAN